MTSLLSSVSTVDHHSTIVDTVIADVNNKNYSIFYFLMLTRFVSQKRKKFKIHHQFCFIAHLQCTDQGYTAKVNCEASIKGRGLHPPCQLKALPAIKALKETISG